MFLIFAMDDAQVDQYYYGANNSIQHAGVQYILDTVVQQCALNLDRKFTFVEQVPSPCLLSQLTCSSIKDWARGYCSPRRRCVPIKNAIPRPLLLRFDVGAPSLVCDPMMSMACGQAFFQRWWNEQPEAVRATTRKLVSGGQLVFINGGWSMHDEACTHFVSMIENTALGHRFLKEQFGVLPRIGWQIDPFGHSATQAALLSAEVGFDATYFARLSPLSRESQSHTSPVFDAHSPGAPHPCPGAPPSRPKQ